ncbi:hypothetical protein TK50_07650 [Micromonospora haikouensis]|uniref:Uncharacterized protein n=1 Tax=Micromonospora haikouensis TaxID=686309 RepID=A0A0D0X318_9ACTN|nr:hypothetical protein TK50_07650 [Micromonospora haikouensis]
MRFAEQVKLHGRGRRGNARFPALPEVRVIVMSEVVSIVFGGLVPGFLLGLLAFRVKSRWCPRCGESTLAMPPTERER